MKESGNSFHISGLRQYSLRRAEVVLEVFGKAGLQISGWPNTLGERVAHPSRLPGFSLILFGIFCLFGSSVNALASPADYLQNNMIANRFVCSADGSVYLVTQNTLFRMWRDEADIWEQVAEDVKSASIDPQNDKVIYAITNNNSVMKTLDGGQRWIAINNGLPRTKINFLFINPSNANEIFAGTEMGLYRTRDAGFAWEPTALNAPISQFYVNPKSADHAYALTSDGYVMGSADSGRTWRKSEAGLPTEIVRRTGRTATKVVVNIKSLILVSQDNTYLLATTVGKGLFRSDDHAVSWRELDTGLGGGAYFAPAYIGEKEVVIAGLGIARSTDGISWTPLPTKAVRFQPLMYEGIARHPRRAGLIILFRFPQDASNVTRIGYVGPGGALTGLSYGLMPRSDVTAVWTGLSDGRRTLFATVSNLTPDPHHRDNSSYLLGQAYYVPETATYFSIDDGNSWEYLVVPQCGLNVAIRPGDSKDIWMFGGVPDGDSSDPIYHGVLKYESCLLKGSGAGLNWSRAVGPRFAFSNDKVSKIVFDPVDKGLLYYCAGVNEHRLYRYKYNPNGNEGQSVDLNVSAQDLIVCEDNPKMLFVKDKRFVQADEVSRINPFGASTNRLGLLSTDAGWTWKDKSAALQKYDADDMTPLSFRGNEIRIALHHRYPLHEPAGVWILKSNNYGDSWEVVSSFERHELTGIFVSPDDSKNIFAIAKVFAKGEYSEKEDSVKVLETKDSGNTWREIYSYKLTGDDRDRGLVRSVTQFSSSNGRSILLGGRVGLLRSNDEGKSWVRLGGAR